MLSDSAFPSLPESTEFAEALEISRTSTMGRFGSRVFFFEPSFNSSPKQRFASISITGTACALSCRHCTGKILETMMPARTPEELLRVCRKLHRSGCLGCLISGGVLDNGSVPLARFLPAIAQIKNELGMTVVAHTGLIDAAFAAEVRDSGVDTVLVDVVGSEETIREVYGTRSNLDDYRDCLEVLRRSGVAFAPHITVGIHYGRIKGEVKALEMVSQCSPNAVIFNAFVPIKATPMENAQSPTPEQVAWMFVLARKALPVVPLVLGCMRPAGVHKTRTDRLAIQAGANGVAFPRHDTASYARTLGAQSVFSPLCCSQIHELSKCEFGRRSSKHHSAV